jgi:hypothetical protein
VIAVLRYQAALLVRSVKWLPPLLLYGAVLAIGTGGRPPMLDALAWAAALILPVTAWLTRVCLLVEPAQARGCVAAAVGPGRTHLVSLLLAVGLGSLLVVVGTVESALVATAVGQGAGSRVPATAALVGGVLAQLTGVLVGVAIGSLCARPVVRRPAFALPLVAAGAMAMLIASGSPASAAVSTIVNASNTGTLRPPWMDVLVALALAVAAAAVTGWVARRVPDD